MLITLDKILQIYMRESLSRPRQSLYRHDLPAVLITTDKILPICMRESLQVHVHVLSCLCAILSVCLILRLYHAESFTTSAFRLNVSVSHFPSVPC